MSETVVKISNLVKRYKELIALDNFSLEINKGEVFGLLGPNGSGKTTTINCLLSLLTYDKGEIEVFGEKMGPKTQGNELGLKKDEFILFDVNINGTWLSNENVIEIARYFGIHTVFDFMDTPVKGRACSTLRGLIEMCAEGEFDDWEGIVAKPQVELRDQAGHRVIVKIKNKDYLRDE